MRHLLYHVTPTGNWLWNLDQLATYCDTFTGKKIFGIVNGRGFEDFSTVVKEVKSRFWDDVEVLKLSNDLVFRETATLLPMLQTLREFVTSPRDIAFYAHTKGVTKADDEAVRLWTETMYLHNLSRVEEVEDELQSRATVGIFRRLGKHGALPAQSTWHFSGTFFWFNCAALFQRKWWRVPAHIRGAEAYPSCVFPLHMSSCLFADDVRSLYKLSYIRKLVSGGKR